MCFCLMKIIVEMCNQIITLLTGLSGLDLHVVHKNTKISKYVDYSKTIIIHLEVKKCD